MVGVYSGMCMYSGVCIVVGVYSGGCVYWLVCVVVVCIVVCV